MSHLPHPSHRINNSALDATPAQNALPCLFSHLPTTLHVVVLEFGSLSYPMVRGKVDVAPVKLSGKVQETSAPTEALDGSTMHSAT